MEGIIQVDGRYRIGEKLESGLYSTVFCSQDIFTGQEFAVKLEPCNGPKSYLKHKYGVLNTLQGGMMPGLPRPIWLGREGVYCIMMLKSLGPFLHKLSLKSSNLFSLSQVAKIRLHLISCLKHIYSYNFIHQDIKPDNILTGIRNEQDTIFLINFGIAQRYHDPLSHIHIPMQENLPLIGTPAFTSVNSHLGLQLSHCDDSEFLTFTLIFLYHGLLL
ncbi:kinase-like domain-containing protein [Boletus coccyginus]|nr:kinase-like domain-containing protein [Boletus coccyginus]